jgi:hypothetical protein
VNARYVTSKLEREYWASQSMDELRLQMFRDSVHPVEDAGLLDLIEVAGAGVEVLGTHFPPPTAGQVVGDAAGARLVFQLPPVSGCGVRALSLSLPNT